MKADNKTARASIDIKHLNPAFYLKGIEQVIDPVIKGLKTEVKITKAGAYVSLKSEMQIIRLEKRKTIRSVWWNSKHDLPLTTKELLQVKIKADQWYSDNKEKSDYKMIYLSELLPEYLKEPGITESTRKGREQCFTPIVKRFSEIEVNDITSDLLLSLQDDLLSCEKWGNSSKKNALVRLSQFMAYAFKVTRNKNISVALTEFNLLKEKIKNDGGHFRTLESTNNAILRSELVKAIQRILTSRTKYKNIFLMFLYIPTRIAEVLSITGENVTRDNIFITKTKTIKETQGGFNVPINDKVYQIVTENLPLAADKQSVLSHIFAYITGFNVHGIRSVFSDYMTREGFQWNLIESCLSHKTSNAVAECYHRDQKNYFYEQRKPLMFHWYDFISDCISEAERLIGQESQG